MFSVSDERKKGFNNDNLINPRMPESELKKSLNSAILYFQSSIKTENALKVMQKSKIRLTENEQSEISDAFLSMRVNEIESQNLSSQNVDSFLKRDIKFINIYNEFGYNINLESRFNIIEQKKEETLNIEKNLYSIRKMFNLPNTSQASHDNKFQSTMPAEEYFCQLERNLLNQAMNKNETVINALSVALCSRCLSDITKTLRTIKEQNLSFSQEKQKEVQNNFIKDRVIKICASKNPKSKANFYIQEDQKILNVLAAFDIHLNIDQKEVWDFFSSLTNFKIYSMAIPENEYGSIIIKTPAIRESIEMYLLLFEKKIFETQLSKNKEKVVRRKVTQRI